MFKLSEYRPVTRLTLDKLQEHEGHEVEIVSYSNNNLVADYALECVDCALVLADWAHKDHKETEIAE